MREKILLLGVLLIAFFTNSALAQQAKSQFWETPLINGDNREIMRAHINPKANRTISLNGKWKFKYSKNPKSRISSFYEKDFNATDWNEIDVPGSWAILRIC